MLRTLLACAAVGWCLPARADDGIPPKTLADIKAATVFVKIETARVSGSGSGFVMRIDGDTALIVTNDHVVSPPVSAGPVRKLEVVFNSGRAKTEAVLSAEVLATDPDRDLAILRVKKVPETAKPLDLGANVELGETMTVYALGFPFGEALATTKGNPAITVVKGSVSSLRENDEGELSVIQIDGDINPGNSGGPVVDSKGRLVGVAVAKVRGTNIGLAIPPTDLTKLLHGRLGATVMRVIKVDGDTMEVELMLRFIDPLNKVTAASVRVAKVEAATPIPKGTKPGEHPELTGGTIHELKVENQQAKVTLKLPLARYFLQPVYTNEVKKDIRVGVEARDLTAMARASTRPDPVRPDPVRPNPVRPVAQPVPVTTPEPTAAVKVDDLTVRQVRVATEVKRAPGVIVSLPIPCLTWAADGKSFYAYDNSAMTVRKFSFPELKEVARLEVGKECNWLCRSTEGLVLTVSGREAWLLDPDTLKKKDLTFPLDGEAQRVLSAPGLDIAYVTSISALREVVRVVDLKTGKTLKSYLARDLDRLRGLSQAVLSPDGKRIFAVGGIEQLVELAVDRENVALAGMSERIAQSGTQPVVSSDGKWVCAPSGGGNRLKDRTDIGYGTVVFKPGNLTDPVVILKTGPYPRAVGFDTKAGLIYGQNSQHQLIVMDAEGTVLKSYALDKGRRKEVSQFLPHPDGRRLVVLTYEGNGWGSEVTAFAVELPAK